MRADNTSFIHKWLGDSLNISPDEKISAMEGAFSLPRDAPDVLRQVGNTPLIELRKIFSSSPNSIRVFAKAEWFNPGGSVKDRAALAMILNALNSGQLNGEKRILDATSGNTGIGYAWIGASLGIGVTLCIPKNASPERIKMLKAFGVELILTDPLEGTDGAIVRARALAETHPEKYHYLDQYNNPVNPLAHYFTTAVEILRDTQRQITHFVACLGTSGTFVGTTKRLREELPFIRAIAVQPDSPFHGIEGVKHMESAIVPGIFDPNLADDTIFVSTDEAQEMTLRLAREEGILVGVSSGAAVAASAKLAESIDEGCIVTILPDRGERYLTDNFWR